MYLSTALLAFTVLIHQGLGLKDHSSEVSDRACFSGCSIWKYANGLHDQHSHSIQTINTVCTACQCTSVRSGTVSLPFSRALQRQPLACKDVTINLINLIPAVV